METFPAFCYVGLCHTKQDNIRRVVNIFNYLVYFYEANNESINGEHVWQFKRYSKMFKQGPCVYIFWYKNDYYLPKVLELVQWITSTIKGKLCRGRLKKSGTIIYITTYLDTQHKAIYYINTWRPEFLLVLEKILKFTTSETFRFLN